MKSISINRFVKRLSILTMVSLLSLSALVSPEPSAPLSVVDAVYAEGSKTVSQVLPGVTRTGLVEWLGFHREDDYYLGTPYASGDYRSPNGDVAQNGGGHSIMQV
jgi:hypothetical protein